MKRRGRRFHEARFLTAGVLVKWGPLVPSDGILTSPLSRLLRMTVFGMRFDAG